MRNQMLAYFFGVTSIVSISSSLGAEPVARLDPSVAQLIELEHTDPSRVDSDFLKTLFAIRENRKWKSFEYRRGSAFAFGRAVSYEQAGEVYVVVILEPGPFVLPGPWTQDLLLLDEQGRLLDRVRCTINSRLGNVGVFRTVFTEEAAQDGARLVVRFTPGEPSGDLANFDHEIRIGAKSFRFRWEEGYGQWNRNGLCRLAIKDGRFDVLYPATLRKNAAD